MLKIPVLLIAALFVIFSCAAFSAVEEPSFGIEKALSDIFLTRELDSFMNELASLAVNPDSLTEYLSSPLTEQATGEEDRFYAQLETAVSTGVPEPQGFRPEEDLPQFSILPERHTEEEHRGFERDAGQDKDRGTFEDEGVFTEKHDYENLREEERERDYYEEAVQQNNQPYNENAGGEHTVAPAGHEYTAAPAQPITGTEAGLIGAGHAASSEHTKVEMPAEGYSEADKQVEESRLTDIEKIEEPAEHFQTIIDYGYEIDNSLQQPYDTKASEADHINKGDNEIQITASAFEKRIEEKGENQAEIPSKEQKIVKPVEEVKPKEAEVVAEEKEKLAPAAGKEPAPEQDAAAQKQKDKPQAAEAKKAGAEKAPAPQVQEMAVSQYVEPEVKEALQSGSPASILATVFKPFVNTRYGYNKFPRMRRVTEQAPGPRPTLAAEPVKVTTGERHSYFIAISGETGVVPASKFIR